MSLLAKLNQFVLLLVGMPYLVMGVEFRLEQRILREWGADYVRDELESFETPGLGIDGFGVIEERTNGDHRGFEISGQLPAVSVEEVTVWGSIQRVSTPNGTVIGIVEKFEYKRPHLFPHFCYVIRNGRGIEIARTGDFFGRRPSFDLVENNGAVNSIHAVGEKRCIWKIHMDPRSELDPRIVWVIAASQTEKGEN